MNSEILCGWNHVIYYSQDDRRIGGKIRVFSYSLETPDTPTFTGLLSSCKIYGCLTISCSDDLFSLIDSFKKLKIYSVCHPVVIDCEIDKIIFYCNKESSIDVDIYFFGEYNKEISKKFFSYEKYDKMEYIDSFFNHGFGTPVSDGNHSLNIPEVLLVKTFKWDVIHCDICNDFLNIELEIGKINRLTIILQNNGMINIEKYRDKIVINIDKYIYELFNCIVESIEDTGIFYKIVYVIKEVKNDTRN